MPQSSPKTPSRSRPTTRDTHGEKTPTPDHGSINGYTHGKKTPTQIYPLFCRKRLNRQKSLSAFFAGGGELLFRTFNPIRDIP